MNSTIDPKTVNKTEAAAYEWIDVQSLRQHINKVTLFAPWWNLHRVTLPIIPYRVARQLCEQLGLSETDLPVFEGVAHLVLHDGLKDLPGERAFQEQPDKEVPTRNSTFDDDEGSPLCRPNNFIRKPAFTISSLCPASSSHFSRWFRSDIAVLSSLRLRHSQLAADAAKQGQKSLEARIAEKTTVPPNERDLWERAVKDRERQREAAMVNDPVTAKLRIMEDRIAQLTAENARLQRI